MMRSAILWTAIAVTSLAPVAEAQRPPDVDSLVAHFVKYGPASRSAIMLVEGCPDLQPWQREAFRKLAAMDLTPIRTSDLANAWGYALGHCHDRDLEQWYFQHLDALMAAEEDRWQWHFWHALSRADSPTIRQYLWDMMVDPQKNMKYRDNAAASLFQRLTVEERVREFSRALAMRAVPGYAAWFWAERIMSQDPAGLIHGIIPAINGRPELLGDFVFRQLVGSARRYASMDDRNRLADAMEAVLGRVPDTPPGRRGLVASEARWLRKPVQDPRSGRRHGRNNAP